MKKGEKRRENGLGKVEIGRFLFDVTILVLLLLGQFGVMQKEARAGMASDTGRAGTRAASYDRMGATQEVSRVYANT